MARLWLCRQFEFAAHELLLGQFVNKCVKIESVMKECAKGESKAEIKAFSGHLLRLQTIVLSTKVSKITKQTFREISPGELWNGPVSHVILSLSQNPTRAVHFFVHTESWDLCACSNVGIDFQFVSGSFFAFPSVIKCRGATQMHQHFDMVCQRGERCFF